MPIEQLLENDISIDYPTPENTYVVSKCQHVDYDLAEIR